MPTFHFTGPSVRRERKGTCPGCHKKVTRSRTFERTVSPFNRHPVEDRPKTWNEVCVDVSAQADAWVPDFTCQTCEFTADVDKLSVEDLLARICMEAWDRNDHRRNKRDSRADLCNQRIVIYEARVHALEPNRVMLDTSHCPDRDGYYCYFEFPDQQRCIFGERHGGGYHLSPTDEQATIGAGLVTQ